MTGPGHNTILIPSETAWIKFRNHPWIQPSLELLLAYLVTHYSEHDVISLRSNFGWTSNVVLSLFGGRVIREGLSIASQGVRIWFAGPSLTR